MTGRERVNAWLSEGKLAHPLEGAPSFVHLVRALVRLGGASVPDEAETDDLTARIGEADHIIFIVIDGMGTEQVARLGADSFFRLHLAGDVRSVFLSTTASALTSLATAEWPAIHAVPGWWTYLEEYGLAAVTLPFIERATKLSLSDLAVDPEVVFPSPSIWPQLSHEMLAVQPARITNSVYSNYAMGGLLRTGYQDFRQAVSLVLKRVETARSRTFTYLYIPELDETAHRLGPNHPEVREVLLSLDWLMGDLARVLAGRARLVITSDHGFAEVDERQRFILGEADPIRRHLVTRPTGEAGVPIFHVQDGHAEEFSKEFDERFGGSFALLTPDDVEAMELLGPCRLSGAMRRRLGTFIGISADPAVFAIRPSHGAEVHKGIHGGLRPSEMCIPLILA